MASDIHSADGPDASDLATATRYLTLALAAVFVVVGVAGFAVTGLDHVVDGFTAHTDQHLLLFEVNPLHNLVHLALGLVGLAMWRTTSMALVYGYLVLVGYFAAFLYGLVAMGQSWDVLSINPADNVLHAALAGAGAVVVGLGHAALADMAPVDRRTWFRAPGRRRGRARA